MPKLQFTAPKQLGDAVDTACNKQQLRKGEALRFLLDLAAARPDYPMSEFSGPGSYNCTYGMEAQDYTVPAYIEYRVANGLRYQNAFFENALLRGASIYRVLDRMKSLTGVKPGDVIEQATALPETPEEVTAKAERAKD